MGKTKTTKENFFSRFGIAPEVLQESGAFTESTPVLEMIRKLKLLMEKGDVDGFDKLMSGSEFEELSGDDAGLLLNTVMTEGRHGLTVFQLCSDIDDLLED